MEPTKDHVSIDSIKINLNGLIVELTPDQARKLWNQLNELFGYVSAAPVWIEWCPARTEIMINPNAEPFPDHWVVTYNAYSPNNKSCLEIHV